MTVPLATICAHIRATLPDCTPADVAAHFAINRFQLSRRFRRETGLSLRDYIAALKIEHGIAALVAQKPVIDSQLDAGHESAATYSHTFRAATGIAPARYRDKIAAYSATLSAELACPQPRTFSYHGYAPQQHPQPRALTVRLRGGEARHVVFAGLFPAPIPRGVPVLGRALFHCREFRIDAVPDGTYYLLACEIPKSRNPLRYFRLDHCLRALHPAPVTFPLPAATTIELSLRPFAPSDPPITVNLPKLLYDFLRQRNP